MVIGLIFLDEILYMYTQVLYNKKKYKASAMDAFLGMIE